MRRVWRIASNGEPVALRNSCTVAQFKNLARARWRLAWVGLKQEGEFKNRVWLKIGKLKLDKR